MHTNSSSKFLKKLLIITDVTGEGGTNTYIYNVLKIAKKRYCDITLLLDDNENMDLMEKKCSLIGVNVLKRKIYHGTNTETDIKAAMIEILKEVNPDLVHVFCGSIRSAICIRETVIEFNIPLFSTETYVAKAYPITNEQIMRVKKIYSNTVKVITVCNSNIKVLREYFGINHDRLFCIPTSSNMRGVTLKKRRIENNINAVVIARLTKQKGIDILIEAFNLIDFQYQKKIQIDIVGDGELKTELISLVEKYKLNNYIHFLGWKNDAYEEIEKYNLGIIPSRDEGLPNVEIEMIKFGLPVLISDVGGMLEATNNGKYAEVFKNGSELELRDALVNILKVPDRILSKTEDAYTYVKNHYDMEVNYEKYLDMWEGEIKTNEIR